MPLYRKYMLLKWFLYVVCFCYPSQKNPTQIEILEKYYTDY